MGSPAVKVPFVTELLKKAARARERKTTEVVIGIALIWLVLREF